MDRFAGTPRQRVSHVINRHGPAVYLQQELQDGGDLGTVTTWNHLVVPPGLDSFLEIPTVPVLGLPDGQQVALVRRKDQGILLPSLTNTAGAIGLHRDRADGKQVRRILCQLVGRIGWFCHQAHLHSPAVDRHRTKRFVVHGGGSHRHA